VYLDPDPEPDVPPATRWRNRLVDGMGENLGLVVAKSVINLNDLGEGLSETPLETAVTFGTKYRSSGWGRGLTTLAAMANLYDDVAHDEKLRALFVGIGSVADDCAGEPPRFAQYELGNADLSKARLKSWFRETCEVRDEDGAERCIRTAANVLPSEDVAEIVVAAVTDHLYVNAGHTLDFVNKAFETLDHLGWNHADDVLASVVPQITDASRAEETSAWRQPVDVAALLFRRVQIPRRPRGGGRGHHLGAPRRLRRRASSTTTRRPSSTPSRTRFATARRANSSPAPLRLRRRAGSPSSPRATSSPTGTRFTTRSPTPTPSSSSPGGPTPSRCTGPASTARRRCTSTGS